MAAPQSSGGGGNLLTQKLGPLATWVWLLIATVLIGIVYLYLKHKSASSTATTTPTTSASQVPDNITQVYLGNTPSGGQQPPTTTPPTTTGTTPPPSTPPPVVSVPPNQPVPVPNAGFPVGLGTVKAKVQIATGRADLKKIAANNGMTENLLVELNPALKAKYWGTGKPIPKGTKVVVAT